MGRSEDLARAARPQAPVPTTGHYTVSGLLKSGLLPPSPRANIFALQALPAGPETCLPPDAREFASLTWGSRNPGRSSEARSPPPPSPRAPHRRCGSACSRGCGRRTCYRQEGGEPLPAAVPSKWVGGWKRPRGLPHHTPVSGAPDWEPSPIARVPRSQGGRLSIQLRRAGA